MGGGGGKRLAPTPGVTTGGGVAYVGVANSTLFAKGPETVGGENAAFMSRRLIGRLAPTTLAFSAVDPRSPCTCDA